MFHKYHKIYTFVQHIYKLLQSIHRLHVSALLGLTYEQVPLILVHFGRHCLLKYILAQHFISFDLKFLYRLTVRAWLAINLTLLVPMRSIIIIKYIHSSNTSTTFYKVSTGYCSYVRPDDSPGGPKHVACGYFVKVCRCVGRMYIFYDNFMLGNVLPKIVW